MKISNIKEKTFNKDYSSIQVIMPSISSTYNKYSLRNW